MPAALSHIDQIAHLTKLRHLRIDNCINNISASVFTSLPYLENLELVDLPSLTHLTSPLVLDIRALKAVRIVRCRNVAPRVLKEIETVCKTVRVLRA